jgi:branched-subunit amino acid transport protein
MVIAGAITFGTRLSFIILFGQRDIPDPIRGALRFVPPAVLTAILFPELFLHSGALDVSLANTRLVAGILAALAAWVTRSIALTILVGMGALLTLQWLM